MAATSGSEVLGLQLLQSVREMKAGQAARVTGAESNELGGIGEADLTELKPVARPRPRLSRKVVLAAAPLEGIDLTRETDSGCKLALGSLEI